MGMAVINTTHKWVYLMEPHTASRAVAKTLKEQCGASDLGHHHISIAELTDRRRTPHNLKNYKVDCTVRNPFDVLVTQWKYSGHAYKPEPDYVLIARYRHDMRLYHRAKKRESKYQPFDVWAYNMINRGAIIEPLKGLWKECSYFAYYENLEGDLSTLFGREIKLHYNPAHKTQEKEPWYTYYNKHLMDVLVPYYNDFLSYFGYIMSDMHLDESVREQRCRRI